MALRSTALEPFERACMLAALAVAARVQHAQTELAGGVSLLGGGREAALGGAEVAFDPQPARVLVTEARQGGRIAGLPRATIPVGGLCRILRDRQSLRLQGLEQRDRRLAGLDAFDRRGRGGVGRRETR